MFLHALKGMLRRPLVTVICLILLTGSLTVSFLGSAMSAAVAPLRALNEEYTEIAVISPLLAYHNSDFAKPTRELYEAILKDGILMNNAIGIDTRVFTEAYSSDLEPISFQWDIYDQATSWLHHQKRGVLVATCVGVETSMSARKTNYLYQYIFEVDQVVYHHESVPAETLKTFSTSHSVTVTDDHSDPYVEVGKTYLCWGNFEYSEGVLRFGFQWGWVNGSNVRWVQQNGMHPLYCPENKDSLAIPFVSELNEPLESFWNTEVGKIWQNTIFESIDIHEHSVTLVGTDCLESIYAFNTGIATVTEGGMFEKGQYETGEKVCIVSRELAEKNGLKVGDALPFSLYASKYPYSNPNTSISYTEGYQSQVGFTETGEWRIVGIYEHEYTPGGGYDLHPNLVFVPKGSTSVEYEVANYDYPDLYMSILLPERGIENFRMDAEAEGYPGWFLCSDNGRAEDEEATRELQEAIETWQAAVAARVAPIPAVSLLLMLLAMLLYVFSKKKEIGALYAIETAQSTLWAHFLTQSVLLIAAAAGLAYVGNLLLIPPLASRLLAESAHGELADTLVAMLPETVSCEPSVIIRRICILPAIAALLAAIGARRRYQFEYHDKKEESE